jgi:hypothetical protein
VGKVFLRVLRFSPISIPLWLSILIYHLEDEQQSCWWLQFRDIVSGCRLAQLCGDPVFVDYLLLLLTEAIPLCNRSPTTSFLEQLQLLQSTNSPFQWNYCVHRNTPPDSILSHTKAVTPPQIISFKTHNKYKLRLIVFRTSYNSAVTGCQMTNATTIIPFRYKSHSVVYIRRISKFKLAYHTVRAAQTYTEGEGERNHG